MSTKIYERIYSAKSRAWNCNKCGEFNNSRNCFGYGKQCGCAQEFYENNPTLNHNSFKEGCECNIHKYCELLYWDRNIQNYVCWECFKDKWNENIDIPNKLKCKRCGNIINNPNDIFCSEKCEKEYIEEKGKYFKTNNKCNNHTKCKLSYHGKCWECFKEEFSKNNVFIDNICEIEDMVKIPTFLSQEDDNWQNARSAFEQYLIDLDIQYFSYIKFGLDDKKNIFLLSGCESGSYLVNNSGSDVLFDYKKDSASRKYLLDNNYQWYKEYIVIKPFDSKKEAKEHEKYLQNKYNLFE